MKLEEIKELIDSLEKGALKKIMIKKGDFELHLEKELSNGRPPAEPASSHHYPPRHESHEERHPIASAHKGSAHAVKPGQFVTSPMVGTFYSSSSPDQPAFVKVGDRVEENTVVCIIEAMKVMNEVKAGISGVVAETLVDNTQPVEFGTKLFRVV